MVIPFAVFAGVLVIVFGLYWLFVVREEERLQDRLTPAAKRVKKRAVRIVKPEDQEKAQAIDEVLARSGRWAYNLRELTEQSGLKINAATLLLFMGVAALVTYLLVFTFVGYWVVAALASFLAACVPYWYVSRARTKRMYKFEELFPEAIDLISRALRAGHGLPTGLQMVADEMPAPIGSEFRTLYDEQNFGLTMPDALRNFAKRIPVLDARFFVTAVLTQRESGGNLAEVLDNLSSVIRERFKVKRQIRVISAHGRITGWVLAALPPCLAMATLVINREHLGTLTGSELGHQMIIAAVSLQVIGTLIMRKIVNVEY
jgi:tight adherence protein B